MDVVLEAVDEWSSRPFSGGYAGLHELADSSFSGVVSADETWAVFVNGRVVAVAGRRETAAGTEFSDGDIEAFADADGTARSAPHPGVALLVGMRLSDGETRAKYYTEDTPIAEVDETLAEGGFTGYLELSENVLSGDYYTVYQAGRSMDVAFVGNARRLQTDEEARESARGEVGIYEVVAVDLDVTTLPKPEGRDATAAVASDPAGDPPPAGGPATVATDDSTSTGDTAATDDGNDEPTTDGDEPVGDAQPGSAVAPETDAGAPAAGVEEPEAGGAPAEGPRAEADERGVGDDPGSAGTDEPPRPDEGADGEPGRSAAAGGGDTSTPAGARGEPSPDDDGAAGAASATATEQLASRSIPSLDPERTASEEGQAHPTGGRRDRPGSATEDREPASSETSDHDGAGELRERLSAVRERLETAEAERDDAREQLAEARETIEAVREERDDLRGEVERLRERVERLESEQAPTAETADGSAAGMTSGRSLSAGEAVAGTDLFVRYDSKGATTVEDACEGNGSPEDLTANVGLDAHTRFETEGTTVDGEPFDEWLAASDRYRFAEWVVSQLVFEIRDTGSADRLAALYDALPAVDRIEFDGEVTGTPDGETHTAAFDLVFRNRMGEPLFVAALDDAREPITEGEMAELVHDGLAVCERAETFAAAFYVTAAFYEPGALETASEATSGSLLSRDSRLSFVKQSRKRGFHLCLVEARDSGSFSLSVPDL